MKELYKNRKKDAILFFVCITVISLCYLLFSVIFRYEDTVSFTAWSVEFWDCLFSDRGLGGYYAYASENIRGAIHGAPQGSWLTFFPWIIWNFPLFLTHMDPSSAVIGQLSIVWSKGLLLACLVVMSVFIYRIVMRLTKGNTIVSLYAVLLTCGSLELLDSLAYAGQDEIIYLTLLVMAVYFTMIGKKGLALFLAILSVTICPLMIVPVFFMFAVYDEKLYVSILKSIACLVPTVLFELCYRNDVIYASLKDINTVNTFQLMMNTSTFPSAMGPVCTAALIMIILAFWVGFVKFDGDKDRRIVTILAVVFVSMCFLMGTTFYRSLMYIPFLVMFVCLETQWFSYKTFLLLVAGGCRFLFFFTNDYNLSTRYLAGGVLKHFDYLPEQVINPISVGYDCAVYIFRVLAFAAVILLFVLHFFGKKITMKNFISEKKMVMIYSLSGLCLVAYFCGVLLLHLF